MNSEATFKSLLVNAQALAEGASWPTAIAVNTDPKSTVGKGSFGWVYPFEQLSGIPHGLLLKKIDMTENEMLRIPFQPDAEGGFHRPANWKCVSDEFGKLCALNGLGGHAPMAYAFGALIESSERGRVATPAYVMQDLRIGFKKLSKVLDQGEALDVASFGLDMLEAIELLKINRIAHGDLSPNNVMVERAPKAGSIRRTALIDFGQAKESVEGVTPKGVMPRLGTPAYAAPEMFLLERRACEGLFDEEEYEDCCKSYFQRNEYTVDLWSLGALLYHLQTGHQPVLPAQQVGTSSKYRDTDGNIVEMERAYALFVAEKRKGLRLPLIETERDKELSKAIEICTSKNPHARKLSIIRSHLLDAQQGGSEQDYETPVILPISTSFGGASGEDEPAIQTAGESGEAAPTLEELAAGTDEAADGVSGPDEEAASSLEKSEPAPDEPVPDAPATTPVLGAFYSMTRPDGAPFSVANRADLLVIGPSKDDIKRSRITIRGASYQLKRVGRIVDMLDRSVISFPSSKFRKIKYACVMGEPRPAHMSAWFSDCFNLTRVIGLSKLDTSQAARLDWVFDTCKKLKHIDLSTLDTGNVVSMENLFRYCGSLESVDLSGWDTSKVSSTKNMFIGCRELKSVDMRGFSTQSLMDTTNMFAMCDKLERVVCSHELASQLRNDGVLSDLSVIVEDESVPGKPAKQEWFNEKRDDDYGTDLDWND